MGPAPRHGHGLVLYQRRIGAAQLRIKAMNAKIVDSVGIETHQILLMVNTSSPGRAANCRASICPIDKGLKLQAPSSKLQAPSSKLQAPSVRQYVALTQDVAATLCHIDTRCRGATICHIDRSSKRQASSPKLQASSFKPSLASSRIREPRYMDIGKVFDARGPRASAMINVLCGCFT